MRGAKRLRSSARRHRNGTVATSTNEESKQGRDVAGATLPSIRGLAADQRVSVITVQRAYESLEREGLIHSRRGKGFFISELHDHEKKDIASMSLAQNISPYIAAAISEGLRPQDVKAVVEQVLMQNIAKQGVTR